MMLQIRAFKQPYRQQGISIFIDDINTTTKTIGAVKHLTFEKVELFETDAEPPIVLPQESAQKLIDDLWDAGLRPSEGSGSAGALKAVQNHLADMKKIAYKLLKLEDQK